MTNTEEGRASLQRSLMEVEKALVQWKAELLQAKEVIAYWEDCMVGWHSARHGQEDAEPYIPLASTCLMHDD